ncbi:TIGR01777 family protein [Lujinxingia litoralis]|uniref:TIGR01777 family protein n=1 Tax=Lujinxingia litoralis TaxID=2211119 RepID=A0A328C7G4_9DELT|nr:DUF1731 domain-containing protein [Lujinxingia litoralis]RAL20484.1 TIGR01777 family protein [Lujinxingia litoralis]
MPEFTRRSGYPVSRQTLYEWHAREGAFERLVPPWEQIEVLEKEGGIEEGGRLIMRLQKGPVGWIWEARHLDHIRGHQFVDEQVRGPFRRWRHTHRFEELHDDQSLLVDEVDYALPLGRVGELLGGRVTERMLEAMFAFRHRRTGDDLRRHKALSARRLKIAISGTSGPVGRALEAFLSTGGHQLLRLVHERASHPGEVTWSEPTNATELSKLEGLDAVVHLAGEPSLGERTPGHSDADYAESTAHLATALARLNHPPEVFLCASSIHIYGDQRTREIHEESELGERPESRRRQAREDATRAAKLAGIRTVNLRIGQVLDPSFGVFSGLHRALKLGSIRRVGSGEQFMSWIDLDDVLGAILFLMGDERGAALSGPINLVAPRALPHSEAMATMARIVGGRRLWPAPAAAVHALSGNPLLREELLASRRVKPARLQESGFEFFYPHLDQALEMKFGMAQRWDQPR